MHETAGGHELYDHLGYILMTAGAAFQLRMRQVLLPFDLNVSQYACLELLAKNPGMSSSDLARDSFTTRQLMSTVLQGLADDGLVSRGEPVGRTVPTHLTERGDARRRAAGAAVRAVEAAMTARFDAEHVERLHADLVACVEALDAYDR